MFLSINHGRSMTASTSNMVSSQAIVEGLFLGGATEALQARKRNPNNIHSIIALIDISNFSGFNAQLNILQMREVKTFADIKEVAEEAFTFLEEQLTAKNQVLVCCRNGENRSVTLVIYFLMKHRGMTFAQAEELVKKHHPKAKLDERMKQALMDEEIQEPPQECAKAINTHLTDSDSAVSVF